MNSPILTAEHAATLNKLVQDLIDPSLFLVCNYEPTIRHAFSEDGCYQLNIQDLYKFAIDCSCVIKQYRKIIPSSLHWQFTQMQKLLDHISMLRTVFDHNVSALNGQLGKENLDSYLVWVRTELGKNAPETASDFELLNQKLANMADDLRNHLDKFIRCASRNPNRNGVVRTWTDLTLHWYCSNTKTDIYKGQLISAYIANAREAGRDTPDLYRLRITGKKVNRWIERALLHPLQSKLDVLSTEIDNYEQMLNGQNPMYQALKAKMSPEKVAEAEERFRITIQEKQQERNRLEQEKNMMQAKIGKDSVAYFYRNLEQQLRCTLESLEQDGIVYTLLPQDLMQEDIARVFGDVASPDGDF